MGDLVCLGAVDGCHINLTPAEEYIYRTSKVCVSQPKVFLGP